MERKKLKSYLLLQCCMLIAFLAVLPQFDLMTAMLGFDMNVMVILSKLVVCAGGTMALIQLFGHLKAEGKEMPPVFLGLVGAGLLIVLLSITSILPGWLEYVALILLGIALFMSKSVLDIVWPKEALRGAFMILLALCLHLYNCIDDSIMTGLAALVGLVFYLLGLDVMKKSLDDTGVMGCSKLKIAIFLSMASVVLDWIPLMGLFASVILIIAFVMEFIGYGLLQKSASLGTEGQQGAGKLRISMIVLLVGTVFGLIPGVGGVFEGIAALIALVLVFLGWSGIILGLNGEGKSRPEIENM